MYSRKAEQRISEAESIVVVEGGPDRNTLTPVDSAADLKHFFRPGERVFALPGWRRPRLYVPSGGWIKRWHQSRFYPASRLHARAFRAALRTSVVFGLSRSRELRPEDSGAWLLRDFVSEALPDFDSAVLLVSSPKDAVKVTAQIWDSKGNIAGYLKYAGSPTTLERLENEFDITQGLPKGIGPETLKYDRMGQGMALLKRPLPGWVPKAEVVPGREALSVLDLLPASEELFEVWEHPFLQRLETLDGFDKRWLEGLSKRRWPVVTQHGDFAPWNTLRVGTGETVVLDWEYGTRVGFPYLDHSYYILQTAALIHRRSPEEATKIATRFLTSTMGLPENIASAVVRITAFDAYTKFSKEGNTAPDRLQTWRRSIWSSTPFPFRNRF